MKAIIAIINIIILVLSANNIKAQIPITREFLKSKIWLLNESLKDTIHFTDTEIIYYVDNEVLGFQYINRIISFSNAECHVLFYLILIKVENVVNGISCL